MELARQAASVLVVFVLLGAALWLIRRRGRPLRALRRGEQRRRRSLHAVERLALTPQHTLHRLRIEIHGEGREVVLATHPQGCTLLNLSTGHSETTSRSAASSGCALEGATA